MQVMTLDQYDAQRDLTVSAGERLPWAKGTDLVHACPGKAGPIRVTLGEPCPYCKQTAPRA